MDALQLARWTRFAAKGGIGKCTATQDCVAENSDDLMFLKDDDITVLMQIPDRPDYYLGYCEGVVGNFHGSDVQFHGKLKRPVITKRTSVSASSSRSKSTSPTSLTPGHSDAEIESLRSITSPPPLPRPDSGSFTPPSKSPYSDRGSPLRDSIKGSFPEDSPLRESSVPNLNVLLSPASSIRKGLFSPETPASAHTPLSAKAVENFHNEQLPAAAPEDRSSRIHLQSSTSSSSVRSQTPLISTPEAGSRRASVHVEVVEVDTEAIIRTESPESMSLESHGVIDPPLAPSDRDSMSSHMSSSTGDQSGLRISNFTDDAGLGVGLAMLQDLAEDDDDADSFDEYINNVRHSVMPPRSSTAEVDDDLPSIHSGDQLYGSPESATVELAGEQDTPVRRPALEQEDSYVEQSGSRPPSSTASGSQGDESDWDGASFLDNYRYSRYSVASKMSGYSSSGRSLEPAPPVPAENPMQRPQMNRMYSYDSAGRSSLAVNETPALTVSPAVSAFGEEQIALDGAHRSAAHSPAVIPTSEHGVLNSGQADASASTTAPLSIRRRPSPLEFVTSPLLHTTFASPLDSAHTLGAPSPLLSPALSTISSRSGTSGGAASALRQRLEVERGTSPALSIDSRFGGEVKDGPGRGRGIVVEDDEDVTLVSAIGQFGGLTSPIAISSQKYPASPLSATATLEQPHDENEIAEADTSMEIAKRQRGGLGLGVANPSTPSPPASPVQENPSTPKSPSIVDPVQRTPRADVLGSHENTPQLPASPPPQDAPGQFRSFSQSFPLPSSDAPPYSEQPLSPSATSGSHLGMSESSSSLFPPHPNAPKRASFIQRPLVLEQQANPTNAPRQLAYLPPPSPSIASYQNLGNPSVVAILQMAAAARFGPNGTARPTTLFGKTVRDLSASEGPVGIVWALEPFPGQPNGPTGISGPTGRPGPTRKQVPQRSATVSPALSQAPQAQSPNTPQFPPNNDQQPVTPGSGAIPRANFFPKAGTARPRSRSFSGFGSVAPAAAEENKPGAKGDQSKKARRAPSSESLRIKPPKSPSVPSAFKSKPPPSPKSKNMPSPLSLPQNNVVVAPIAPTRQPSSSPLANPPILNQEENPPSSASLTGAMPGSSRRVPLRQASSTISLRSSSNSTGASGLQSPPPANTQFANNPLRRRSSTETGLDAMPPMSPMIDSGRSSYRGRDRGGIMEVVPPMSPGAASQRERGGIMEVIQPMSPSMAGHGRNRGGVMEVIQPLSPATSNYSQRDRGGPNEGIPSTPPASTTYSPMGRGGNMTSMSSTLTGGSHPQRERGGVIEVVPPMTPMQGGSTAPPRERGGMIEVVPPMSPVTRTPSQAGRRDTVEVSSPMSPSSADNTFPQREHRTTIEITPPVAPASPMPSSRERGVVSPVNMRSPPLRRVSLDRRTIEDSKKSSSPVDLRLNMLSPSPVSSPTSSSYSTRGTSIQTKSSLSAIHTGGSGGRSSISSPATTPATPVFEYSNETVQVKDTDFEMIRPTVVRQSSEGRSDDSSLRDGRPSFNNEFRPESPAASSIHLALSRTQSHAASEGGSSSPGLLKASDSNNSVEAHRARELRWISAMSSTPSSQARKSKKIRKLLQEGVPSSVRYLVWAHVTDSKARRINGVYEKLGQREKVVACSAIEKDAKACFKDQEHLHDKEGPLVSLLNAYLRMVPDIEYEQSLSIIAGHLLLQSPEEDAFWTFLAMMDAQLRPYFSPKAMQMDADALVFSKAVEAVDAQLYQKLFVDMDIGASQFVRPWFSSLFAGALPNEYVNRVWDIYLYEGPPFLFKVGLALLLSARQDILASRDKSQLLSYLLSPPIAALPPDPDSLISIALSVKLKDDDIRKQRTKLEAQMRRQTQGPSRSGTSSSLTISLPRS